MFQDGFDRIPQETKHNHFVLDQCYVKSKELDFRSLKQCGWFEKYLGTLFIQCYSSNFIFQLSGLILWLLCVVLTYLLLTLVLTEVLRNTSHYKPGDWLLPTDTR